MFSIVFFTLLVLISSDSNVNANECVACPQPSVKEAICAVDDQGAFKKFGSECLMRFENCDRKTSELRKVLCVDYVCRKLGIEKLMKLTSHVKLAIARKE